MSTKSVELAEFVGWPYHMRWDATQDVWQRIGMASVVFTTQQSVGFEDSAADSKVGPVLVTCWVCVACIMLSADWCVRPTLLLWMASHTAAYNMSPGWKEGHQSHWRPDPVTVFGISDRCGKDTARAVPLVMGHWLQMSEVEMVDVQSGQNQRITCYTMICVTLTQEVLALITKRSSVPCHKEEWCALSQRGVACLVTKRSGVPCHEVGWSWHKVLFTIKSTTSNLLNQHKTCVTFQNGNLLCKLTTAPKC